MTIFQYWFVQFKFPLHNEIKFSFNSIVKKQIPSNWKVEKITEKFKVYQPETISNQLFNDNDEYYVYGAGGHIGNYLNFNHLKSEVIISCRGSCGNIYFTKPKSWITGNAMVITPKINQNLDIYIWLS